MFFYVHMHRAVDKMLLRNGPTNIFISYQYCVCLVHISRVSSVELENSSRSERMDDEDDEYKNSTTYAIDRKKNHFAIEVVIKSSCNSSLPFSFSSDRIHSIDLLFVVEL